MKIGVDARLLCKPITGISRALIEIGKRLSHINPDITFYTPFEISSEFKFNLHVCAFNNSLDEGRFFEQLWFQSFLPQQIKKNKIDVFWAPSHRIPFLIPSSTAKVLTIHDLTWVTHPETMNFFGFFLDSLLMPYSINSADKIMAISNSTRHELLEKFPLIEDKISVIKLGSSGFLINPDLNPFKKFGIQREYILFVGTIEPRKNLSRLIEAFSRLDLIVRSQYDLVIVGRDGWGNIDLNNIVHSYDLSNNVKFLGYLTDEDLSSLYQHAILLAMPSLSEGFGLPILEAMAAGIPVLTSNCSSMPEIAGNAALLVDPLSVNSIHSGLERLLVDPQLRKYLSSNAKKNVLKYSWDKSANDLMHLFEDAIISHKVK